MFKISRETIEKFGKDAISVMVKQSPKLLTGLGIIGMFLAVREFLKNKNKADLLLDEAKAVKAEAEGKNVVDESDSIMLTPIEKVRALAPAYWLAVLEFILSAAAIIGSDYISDKRQAALSAAFSLAELSLKEFQDKTEEMVGGKKRNEIEQQVLQDKVNTSPLDVNSKLIQYFDTNQLTLFYEPAMNHYFMARITDVDDLFNQLNATLNRGENVTLNDFYYGLANIATSEYDLGESDTGSILGWKYEDGIIEHEYVGAIEPNTGRPCLKIKFTTRYKDLYEEDYVYRRL